MQSSDNAGQEPDSALEAWLKLVGRTGEAPHHSPVYRMKLAGPGAERLAGHPMDPRPRNPERGRRIIAGEWRFGAAKINTPESCAPWGPPFPTPHFADRIHRFHWLRDVAAVGPSGEAHARALTIAWVDRYGKWEPFAWRTSVTADRVVNMLCAGPWLSEGMDGPVRKDFIESLARQARHLLYSGEEEADPFGRFRIAIALCLSGAALGEPGQIEDGLIRLEKECTRQILADGGHASRSPEALAEALMDLQLTEEFLLRLGVNAPAFLTRLQQRMSSMLSFFTLPGGGLLPANGGGDGSGGLAAAAMRPYADTVARFSFARLSGFQRIQAEDLTLYMDMGTGPERDLGGRAHAGALGIHVCDGAETLITSCAAHADLEPAMREASRQTPAHSVLSAAGENSAIFMPDVESGLRAPVGPAAISARRLEENDQYLLEGQHSGWRSRRGVIYRRRLYVGREGDQITGEDTLARPISDADAVQTEKIPYEIRFHLHPDVKVAREEDGRTIFMGLPRTERLWRFRSEALLSLEDSRYWGAGDTRRTLQIVIRGEAEPDGDGSKPPNRVRWGLKRQG